MYILWFSVAFLVVGVNSVKSNQRLIGGLAAKEGDFPYQALILHSNSRANGALISIQHVVTTAIAVESLKEGLVILGAVELAATGKNNWQSFEISQKNIMIHEEFDEETLNFNIALVTLPQAVNVTENVRPIKLPDQMDFRNFFEAQEVYITGYGARRIENTTRMAKCLSYITTTIFNPTACAAHFENIGDQGLCTDRQEDGFACNGDEGAPVVLKDPQNKKLIGLITLAIGCDSDTFAAADLSVRVSQFTDWINGRLDLGV